MSETTQTISDLAGEAYSYFERAERTDGDHYTRTKDGTPEWVRDLVHDAHGGLFLPDDWRYDAIWNALGAIHDSGAEDADDLDDLAHEWADGEVDVYNAARTEWLASSLDRAAYVDEAREQFGTEGADLFDQLGSGQYVELTEVFGSVRQSLENRMDED